MIEPYTSEWWDRMEARYCEMDLAELRAEIERLRTALKHIADHPVSDEVADFARKALG